MRPSSEYLAALRAGCSVRNIQARPPLQTYFVFDVEDPCGDDDYWDDGYWDDYGVGDETEEQI